MADEPYMTWPEGSLNPAESLELVKEAIAGKRIDVRLVERAVNATLADYVRQLYVFSIGYAKQKVGRIYAAMEAMEAIETQLWDKERIERASTDQLIKMYSVANSVASESADYIQKVLKLRPDLEKLGVNVGADESTIIQRVEEQDDLPILSPAQRDRVRRILAGVIGIEVSTKKDETP